MIRKLLALFLLAGAFLMADAIYSFSGGNAGWTQMRNVSAAMTDEALVLTVKGKHPNIGISCIEVKPTRLFLVEYRLSGREGTDYGRLYFGTDAEPQLGEDKKVTFRGLVPDGEWHTLAVSAESNRKWREATAITALRFDFMEKAQGTLAIRRISLADSRPVEPCPTWDFTKGDQEWDSLRNAKGEITDEGYELTITGAHPHVANYRLNVDPSTCEALELTYKASDYPVKKAFMRVFFGTQKSPTLDEKKKIGVGFVVADGEWHTMRISPSAAAGGRSLWFNGGSITKIRIDFAEAGGSGTFTLKALKPVVTREGAWRREVRLRGIPETVPVRMGTTPVRRREAVFDRNQPFFASLMAAPAGKKTARGSVYVRKEFELPKGGVKQALFQSVVDDRMVRVFINGKAVSHKWQSSWQRSDCVDVTSLLQAGRNVLALEYFNDGAVGGVMYELSVLLPDGRFIPVTTEGALAAFGAAPEDWNGMQPASTEAFKPVELFPGPPNAPWTAAIPVYKNIREPAGTVEVESFRCDGFRLKAVFRTDKPLTGDEVFYAHLNRADDSLVCYASGKADTLRTNRLSPTRVEVDFGELDLPKYGGEIKARLNLGIYNRRALTGKAPGMLRIPARPFPGKPFELKAVRTPNGVVAMKDGAPFFFNVLTINNLMVPTGQEGPGSPFNMVAFRAGGLNTIWWIGPDQYDFTEVDRVISRMLREYPDSLIGVYVWCQPGVWYERLYPERISRQANRSIMRYYTATVSFSNEEYRKDAQKAIARFVEHCETNFGGKIALYNLMGGISCEWQGWNAHTSQLADYSAGGRRDFDRWLAEHAPEQAGKEMPTFEERTRTAANSTLFRDPVRDGLSMLYDRFYSESIADCVAGLAAVAKQACGGRKLVGCYYGYHMEYGNLGFCMSGGGHNALHRLLASPDVDFILSPHAYNIRQLGSPNADMKPFRSVNLHGKFSMHEDDTRTSCTGYDGFHHALNPDQTREILRRNLGVQLARKVPLNQLPLVGGNDLNSPEIRADFAKALKAGQRVFERNMPRVSEVAVVIDEQSARLLAASQMRVTSFLPWVIAYDRTGTLQSPEIKVMLLTGELISYQRAVLGQIGCPVDYILLEDAPSAAKRYKLLILLDCFEDTPLLRSTFRNAKEAGNSILSVYGSGFMGRNGMDVAALSTLLGMKMHVAPAGPLQVAFGDRKVGGEYVFEPRFAVSDTNATPLASYSDGKGIAAASRGRVTFYGGAQLDAAFVQEVARKAGVHIYLASGDNLEVGCGILSLHASSRGRKTIMLPKPARLVEIFTGETIETPNGRVEIEMDALTTKVFSIE